jgi:hypothetical protein
MINFGQNWLKTNILGNISVICQNVWVERERERKREGECERE